MMLKRRTSQNIVWGGIAGCFPPLIGWTAVTGSIALAPVHAVRHRVLLDAAAHLGAGHALPRGLRPRRRADAAGRRTAPGVARQIVIYTVITVAVSLAALADRADRLALPGGRRRRRRRRLVWEAHGLLRRANAGLRDAALKPMRLFHWSNSYLALVFVAAAVDPLLF